MVKIFVSVASNVDRIRNVTWAVNELERHFGVLRQSGTCESDPLGFEAHPFFKAVVEFTCNEPPRKLISILRSMEARSGRHRDDPHLGPRMLDLDLLIYDDQIIHCDGLVMPRHEMAEYAFVLRPLAEIAGGRCPPVTGESFADMCSRFDDAGKATRRVAASITELSQSNPAGRAERLRPAQATQQGSAER